MLFAWRKAPGHWWLLVASLSPPAQPASASWLPRAAFVSALFAVVRIVCLRGCALSFGSSPGTRLAWRPPLGASGGVSRSPASHHREASHRRDTRRSTLAHSWGGMSLPIAIGCRVGGMPVSCLSVHHPTTGVGIRFVCAWLGTHSFTEFFPPTHRRGCAADAAAGWFGVVQVY